MSIKLVELMLVLCLSLGAWGRPFSRSGSSGAQSSLEASEVKERGAVGRPSSPKYLGHMPAPRTEEDEEEDLMIYRVEDAGRVMDALRAAEEIGQAHDVPMALKEASGRWTGLSPAISPSQIAQDSTITMGWIWGRCSSFFSTVEIQ